jgi:hypothetical protein
MFAPGCVSDSGLLPVAEGHFQLLRDLHPNMNSLLQSFFRHDFSFPAVLSNGLKNKFVCIFTFGTTELLQSYSWHCAQCSCTRNCSLIYVFQKLSNSFQTTFKQLFIPAPSSLECSSPRAPRAILSWATTTTRTTSASHAWTSASSSPSSAGSSPDPHTGAEILKVRCVLIEYLMQIHATRS